MVITNAKYVNIKRLESGHVRKDVLEYLNQLPSDHPHWLKVERTVVKVANKRPAGPAGSLGMFGRMDKDGDGKVSAKEFFGYIFGLLSIGASVLISMLS